MSYEFNLFVSLQRTCRIKMQTYLAAFLSIEKEKEDCFEAFCSIKLITTFVTGGNKLSTTDRCTWWRSCSSGESCVLPLQHNSNCGCVGSTRS